MDYRKASDMVAHSRIQCMEVFGVAANVRFFIKVSMKQ